MIAKIAILVQNVTIIEVLQIWKPKKKNIDIDKAASWFGDYLTELRDSVNWFYGSSKMKSGKDRFMEAMKKQYMKTVIIKCRDLMVGDWVANRNGSPMQLVAVNEDNAYAYEGNV